MFIKPPYLKKGDTIAIAATARKVSPEDLQFAISFIEKKGFKVVLAKNIYSLFHQFAGEDIVRAEAFQELIERKDIQAILIARGGYGTVRIIDRIDFTPLKKYPKWICGFSDITVLHAHLFQLGVQSVHSTMPVLFHQSLEATDSLFKILRGEKINYFIPWHPLNREGECSGTLVGGNLSVLYSLNGSVSQLNFEDKILFMEDVDEYLYHIDRMVMQLKRAGVLMRLKGLIVGGFTDMKDNTIPFGKTAEEIIYDAVKEYDYPVCFNFPAGHIKDNYAFIHGGNIRLKVKKGGVEVEWLE
ncbi:MAG: peptidase S66 [Bacteroidia bacterium]|nr:MAG: peptidase S66 [Bacteroidia bacterium]